MFEPVAQMRPDLEQLSSDDLNRIAARLRKFCAAHAENETAAVAVASSFGLMIKDILEKRSESKGES